METARTVPGSFVWVGLHAPAAGRLHSIAEAFGLHPLAVEDALHAHQRPKLERYGSTLFLVLKTVARGAPGRTVPAGEPAESGEFLIFAGPGFIVVVRHGCAPALGGVRRHLEAHPQRLAHGPAAVLHAIADTVVDQYLDAVTSLEAETEDVEARAFSPGGGHDIARVHRLKRELTALRRIAVPLLQPLRRLAERRLPGVDKDTATYFRDVHDHLTRATERLTVLTELVDTALTLTLTHTGLQQSTDLRRISAAAALIAVPIAIFGIYGMNFGHMPELRWILGYPMVVTATTAICALIHHAFRRSGWL
ncbi:magnesium and cobalt transport protein CorA [Streptomyces sp. NPDC018045]|uniref:magnesium and cobalt transport protein CorA n=1 Tax=Streptomyces sp. NPDC018045 TaxID=3365037 RepID=UPI0037A6A9B0